MERQSLVQRVRALAEALEGSEVNELDLTEGGVRIAIKRQLEEPTPLAPPAAHVSPARQPARAAKREQSAGSRSAASAPVESQGIAITAPLTGVFYLTPSPSSPPFVQVGEPVQAGQVVCIVEAMKVFNEIKAEISGTVAAIVAENGQLVQKGEALIRVKPI
jgi:acetyl-CoA carboxylase biotin carboxyl carrier protein